MQNNSKKPYIELSSEAFLKDSSGLPTACRLFIAGETPITTCGKKYILNFSRADLANIVDFHIAKGTKIPIDSDHFMDYLAKQNGVSETDLVHLFPTVRGQIGACDLALKEDELWAENIEFSEKAKPFIQAAALRFFSPAIKGLDGNGALRITSIGMVSNPGIDQMAQVVFNGEGGNPLEGNIKNSTQKGSPKMLQKILEKLKEVTGIELTPESPDDVVNQVIEKLDAKTKSTLELSAEAEKLKKENEEETNSLRERVKALELGAETESRKNLIELGKRDGKVTEALVPFLLTLSSEQIKSYLETAPVIVPKGKVVHAKAQLESEITLSAEDRIVAQKMGLTEEQMLATKKIMQKEGN